MKGVINMENSLTEREKEVIELMIEGYNNSQISNKLSISIHTVKVYASSIYRKLDVQNRIQAVVKYLLNKNRLSI